MGVPIKRILIFWCLYWGLFWETTKSGDILKERCSLCLSVSSPNPDPAGMLGGLSSEVTPFTHTGEAGVGFRVLGFRVGGGLFANPSLLSMRTNKNTITACYGSANSFHLIFHYPYITPK